jgi:tRNA threonylcarbamoyladenosine biosynthesis protein TsaB
LASLFIDTTYDTTLGLLDDDLEWICFEKFIGQKVSRVIQKEVHQFLSANNLKPADLECVISIAGPGFYTGLRLSEGFADVFTFFGVKHYSFFTYQIPKLTGIRLGVWMTKAYRGEYFFHHWGDDTQENILVPSNELAAYMAKMDDQPCYIHSEAALDELSLSLISHYKTTNELLKNSSAEIFKSIIAMNSKVDSFYFRAPEDEFKVSV